MLRLAPGPRQTIGTEVLMQKTVRLTRGAARSRRGWPSSGARQQGTARRGHVGRNLYPPWRGMVTPLKPKRGCGRLTLLGDARRGCQAVAELRIRPSRSSTQGVSRSCSLRLCVRLDAPFPTHLSPRRNKRHRRGIRTHGLAKSCKLAPLRSRGRSTSDQSSRRSAALVGPMDGQHPNWAVPSSTMVAQATPSLRPDANIRTDVSL